ncbi:hypothetical protein KBD34_04920, partial [Patescibacteria group bacterium]|nr:hypothetical protein [Patescibacteria group bacterium]
MLSLFLPTNSLVAQTVDAEETSPPAKEQIDDLQAQVKDSQAKIRELDATIGSYRKRISQQELQSLSLQNQAALLENRIQEKQLALQRAVQETDLTTLQIRQLDVSIRLEEQAIEKRRAALGE